MKLVNIHDAKARLSEFVELVQTGERVLICKRNEPVAEIRPIAQPRSQPRPLGGVPLEIPPAFFESLPEEELDAFYGPLKSTASPAAEASAPFDATSARRTGPPQR